MYNNINGRAGAHRPDRRNLRRRGARGAVLAAPGVADNGGPHECPPQPFWTGVAMAPCFTSFPTRWTYSPHRFMQVPTNADFRSLSDSHVFGTVLHERTLNANSYSTLRPSTPLSARFLPLGYIQSPVFAQALMENPTGAGTGLRGSCRWVRCQGMTFPPRAARPNLTRRPSFACPVRECIRPRRIQTT